jgi:Pentapeptide repeats (8 copies)
MMKPRCFSTTTFATTTLLMLLGAATAVRAENPNHLRQLLETGRCRNCDLSQANLSRENLSNADLAGANLRSANLSYTDLSNADLSSANLQDANLQNAKLNRTIVTNANVRGTILDRNSQNSNGRNRQNWGRQSGQRQDAGHHGWGQEHRRQRSNSDWSNQSNYPNYPNQPNYSNQPVYSNQPAPSNNIDQRYLNYEAEIRRAYQDATNQSIDHQTLQRYMRDLVDGRSSLDDLRRNIIQSPAARACLNAVYQQLLGRDVDAGGLQTWTDYMMGGRTLVDVQREVFYSEEAKARR